jgi:hypothetical protein
MHSPEMQLALARSHPRASWILADVLLFDDNVSLPAVAALIDSYAVKLMGFRRLILLPEPGRA